MKVVACCASMVLQALPLHISVKKTKSLSFEVGKVYPFLQTLLGNRPRSYHHTNGCVSWEMLGGPGRLRLALNRLTSLNGSEATGLLDSAECPTL